ncbi:MAG: proline/glycine betaine ABC transporter permease [Chloroflexi bacterium]|nr:proline/glycine betaine ABC transporter permease [Chloroflexota bacterium]
MFEFPEFIYLPLDRWTSALVDWLTVNGEAFFDVVGDVLLSPMLGLEQLLLWIPWWVIILAAAGLAWKQKGWRMALGVTAGMFFIGTLGLWDMAMKTLAIVIAAALLALMIGVPIGIGMARSEKMRGIVRPILDMMQTMPSFVYLIPALMLFGLGKVPALISTLIYAIPPVIRLTDLGIRQVPADVIEASRAFGATGRQMLMKVQLPLAAPTIMTGVNQTIMMALAMVVIASMIGAGGLGTEVLNGIARLDVGRGFNGGISIVVMAIIIDRLTQSAAQPRTS